MDREQIWMAELSDKHRKTGLKKRMALKIGLKVMLQGSKRQRVLCGRPHQSPRSIVPGNKLLGFGTTPWLVKGMSRW